MTRELVTTPGLLEMLVDVMLEILPLRWRGHGQVIQEEFSDLAGCTEVGRANVSRNGLQPCLKLTILSVRHRAKLAQIESAPEEMVDHAHAVRAGVLQRDGQNALGG